MQDIAAEAGYAAPSLYRYFPGGRGAIVRGFLRLLHAEMSQEFDSPAPAGLKFAQRLELLLVRQAECLERWRAAFAIVPRSQPTGARRSERLQAGAGTVDIDRAYVGQLAMWLRRNASPVDLAGHEPRQAAFLLKGVVHGIFQQWVDEGLRWRLTDRAPLVSGFFLHGLSGAVPPAKKKGAHR